MSAPPPPAAAAAPIEEDEDAYRATVRRVSNAVPTRSARQSMPETARLDALDTRRQPRMSQSAGQADGMHTETMLEHEWGFWWTDASAGSRSRRNDWGAQVEPFDKEGAHLDTSPRSINSIEEYWRVVNNLILPSSASNTNLFLFRYGVKPAWEHPRFSGGGRFIISLGGDEAQSLTDACWIISMTGLVGEIIFGTSSSDDNEGDMSGYYEPLGVAAVFKMKSGSQPFGKVEIWVAPGPKVGSLTGTRGLCNRLKEFLEEGIPHINADLDFVGASDIVFRGFDADAGGGNTERRSGRKEVNRGGHKIWR